MPEQRVRDNIDRLLSAEERATFIELSGRRTIPQVARDANAIRDFKAWVESHRDEYVALRIFFDQPWRRRELTYAMIEELLAKLRTDRPDLAPTAVWRAYERIEKAEGSPVSELSALVSLVRRATDIDTALRAYDRTVDRNFKA